MLIEREHYTFRKQTFCREQSAELPKDTVFQAFPDSSDNPLWYKDAVFYELHVEVFQDSNGNGISDFNS